MIRINNISFDFTADSEDFATGLYADWDNFCRECFEKVVEECLSSHDKNRVLYVMETLDLDLGNIPEEHFYREFPIRLKEELLKVLPSLNGPDEVQEENTTVSRMANLLFYLEHGYMTTEWADSDFNLTEELNWAVSQLALYTKRIVMLCLEKEYVLRRLLRQVNDEKLLVKLYSAIFLKTSTTGLREKRRFLVQLLEIKPAIPVRFIHETTNNTELQNMAQLLDNMSVHRIIEKETEEHAEVDLPPYWYYLYEWLIRYYPFNGLAIFGGKGDFIRHLHFRLLTFIHKRDYSYYLSKKELTVSFLIEVFGTDYYIEVLNAIYDLQPHSADGSPVYDGYLNRELYNIFLQLSLLHRPIVEVEGKKELVFGKENTVSLSSTQSLTAYLMDSQKSRADKQTFLGLLAKEKPEILIDWLQTVVPKDDVAVSALLSAVVVITNNAILNRLLASVSFRTTEVALRIKEYLRSHAPEIGWLSGVTESRLDFALRKSTLIWIGNGYYALPELEAIRHLLRLVCREITGGNREEDIERLSKKLHLSEKDWKQLDENEVTAIAATYLWKLKTALTDKSIPEIIRRRMIVLFLEKSKNSYADAILSLHEQGLLEVAFSLISQPVLEEIIKQSVVRICGTYSATVAFPLFYGLSFQEQDLSAYLRDTTTGLKIQILVWLAKATQVQMDAKRRTVMELYSSLIAALFKKEDMPSVISLLSRRTEMGTNTGDMDSFDIQDFKAWLHQPENSLNIVQTLLESRWKTDEGFTGWLEDTAVSEDNKRTLLQKLVAEEPLVWIRLLRKQPRESKVIALATNCLSAPRLLQGMARADFYQESVLSRTVEWLQRKAGSFAFLTGNNILLSTALSKALLLYMQDEDTLGGRTLTEKETVYKFLSYLHLVYTGKTDYRDDIEWADLSGRIATELETDDKDADNSLIKRIVTTSDVTVLDQLAASLSTIPGFEHFDAFRRLMEWLSRIATNRTSVSETVSVLLYWLKETDWRKQTPEQMEDYFISRLFVGDAVRLPIESIADSTLPESIRRRLFHGYTRFQPKELSDYIRQSVKRNVVPLDKWLEWLDISDWMRMAANLSLSQAELLQQIMARLSENNQVKETDLLTALATCLINNRAENWIYNSREETVHSFIQSLPSLQENTKINIKIMEENMKKELNITGEENQPSTENQVESPEYLLVGNAGLCLFSPWFYRLMKLLGYLNEDNCDFKDTESRIRAIFLLQYLACSEEKTYRETELVFNRLLVALPTHIPLPERLTLTEEEKESAKSLIESAKGHWTNMHSTTIFVIQDGFITRTGRLEQQEKRWLLTVNEQAFDIMLDSIPWEFRQIRLPWLKKYVQVVWREKQ